MMLENTAGNWWAVARSEEVTAKKPLSTDIGGQPLVLWRDAGGVATAARIAGRRSRAAA